MAAARTPASPPRKECDYDTSPTALYQAIEGRRWDYVQTLLDPEDDINATKQQTKRKEAATWVVRKESNGRLRWRLLPIHAAIIFQAPSIVIEALLLEHPPGASAKDDQGMLPLHLVLRNQPMNWTIVEELLTAYPAAVFVKDRKGRTPLQGGLAAIAAWTRKQSDTPGHAAVQHKAALSVLDLYCSILVAGEKSKWTNRRHPDGGVVVAPADWQQRLAALAQQHATRLTELRDEFESEQSVRQSQMEITVRELQEDLTSAVQVRDTLQKRWKNLAAAHAQLQKEHAAAQAQHKERYHAVCVENEKLRHMVEQLLQDNQKLTQTCEQEWKELSAWQDRCQEMWTSYRNSQAARQHRQAQFWRDCQQELETQYEDRREDYALLDTSVAQTVQDYLAGAYKQPVVEEVNEESAKREDKGDDGGDLKDNETQTAEDDSEKSTVDKSRALAALEETEKNARKSVEKEETQATVSRNADTKEENKITSSLAQTKVINGPAGQASKEDNVEEENSNNEAGANEPTSKEGARTGEDKACGELAQETTTVAENKDEEVCSESSANGGRSPSNCEDNLAAEEESGRTESETGRKSTDAEDEASSANNECSPSAEEENCFDSHAAEQGEISATEGKDYNHIPNEPIADAGLMAPTEGETDSNDNQDAIDIRKAELSSHSINGKEWEENGPKHNGSPDSHKEACTNTEQKILLDESGSESHVAEEAEEKKEDGDGNIMEPVLESTPQKDKVVEGRGMSPDGQANDTLTQISPVIMPSGDVVAVSRNSQTGGIIVSGSVGESETKVVLSPPSSAMSDVMRRAVEAQSPSYPPTASFGRPTPEEVASRIQRLKTSASWSPASPVVHRYNLPPSEEEQK